MSFEFYYLWDAAKAGPRTKERVTYYVSNHFDCPPSSMTSISSWRNRLFLGLAGLDRHLDVHDLKREMRSNNHEAEPEFLSDQPEIPEIERTQSPAPASGHNAFIGFAAGICSGWTKLIVGHPFDTIKTRLQCAPPGTFKGAWPCLVETVSKEGPRALYKGASVPAISWGITDSILMGRCVSPLVLCSLTMC